jgi:hypothetical protein
MLVKLRMRTWLVVLMLVERALLRTEGLIAQGAGRATVVVARWYTMSERRVRSGGPLLLLPQPLPLVAVDLLRVLGLEGWMMWAVLMIQVWMR